MKITYVLMTALTAGTLFAQAPAEELDARIQVFGELIRPVSITLADGSKDQAKGSVGLGVRFMGEIASAHNWYYELAGKLDSSSNLTLNNADVNLSDVKITHSYWAVGAGYLMPLSRAVSLGFHLEGRGEAISAQGAVFTNASVGRVSASNSYLRPWGRLTLDATLGTQKVRPYFGLEVAATPVKTSQTEALADMTNLDDRTLRSMAPLVSGAFYVGMHF